MKYVITSFLLAVLLLISFMVKSSKTTIPLSQKTELDKHVYVSWDTMEFDKCVAAWLIVRFIDKNAQFMFVPKGSEVTEGIPFDIPGADWSRKHRTCTSQCVFELIKNPDPAVTKIVSIAAQIELNYWQLDRFPKAQECFYKVKEIINRTPEPARCFENTCSYFDDLYRDLKKNNL